MRPCKIFGSQTEVEGTWVLLFCNINHLSFPRREHLRVNNSGCSSLISSTDRFGYIQPVFYTKNIHLFKFVLIISLLDLERNHFREA